VVITVLVPVFWLIHPTAVLRNGMGGIFWATISALTSSRVEPREQGRLQGVTSALQNLMAATGPLAAGTLYDTVSPAAPLLLGALVLACGAALVLRVPKPPSRTTVANVQGG
jgi:MFS family permease